MKNSLPFRLHCQKCRLFIFLAFILLALGCNSDDDEGDLSQGITGQWILVEMLADPGDGSGTFMTVDSERTITFEEDGTYEANADICSFTSTDGNFTAGTYSEADDGFTIDCEGPFLAPLNLSIVNGELIIAFTCIEPCLQKFRRVE